MWRSIGDFLNKEYFLDKRIEFYRNRKFFSVEIEFSKTCNESCAYCFTNSIPMATPSIGFSTAKDIIDDLMEYGVRSFWWVGGGEGLLGPDWYKTVGYAKQQDPDENLLFTNGLALTKENCQRLVRVVDRVNIHLDTINPESFSIIQEHRRDARKIHELTMEGIENLLDTGFDPMRIRWNITLTKTSLKDLSETLDRMVTWGSTSITLIPLFKAGRCSQDFYDREHLTPEEMQRAFDLRTAATKMPFLADLGVAEYCKQYQLTSFCINNEGEVLPYVDNYTSYGNIHNERASEIVARSFDKLSFSELVSPSTFENRLSGVCGSCKHMRYCFGNPTMVSEDREGLRSSDPFCWMYSPYRGERTATL